MQTPEDSVAKLLASLQRKASEMADVLDSNPLNELDLTEATKKFDRLKAIWESAPEVVKAIKMISEGAEEESKKQKELAKYAEQAKIYGITPESISNVLSSK